MIENLQFQCSLYQGHFNFESNCITGASIVVLNVVLLMVHTTIVWYANTIGYAFANMIY